MRRWVTPVRGFFLRKLSYFLEFGDETCRKWTLDIYAGSYCVIFGFGHQGAELLLAKGEKMVVKKSLCEVLGGCSRVHHTPCTCVRVSITLFLLFFQTKKELLKSCK